MAAMIGQAHRVEQIGKQSSKKASVMSHPISVRQGKIGMSVILWQHARVG